MTQNIYDDPTFFDGYSRLGRSVEGLDGAAEWHALRALLPDLRGMKVVDLGCGYGWFCRWAAEHGAQKILGLDRFHDSSSRRMGADRRTDDSAARAG